jgi:hypothetical protein
MSNSTRRSKSARKANPASKAALGRYLAAGLGATGLASVDSEAAVVDLDVTAYNGVNAGLVDGFSGPLAVAPLGNFGVINAVTLGGALYGAPAIGFYGNYNDSLGLDTQFASGGSAATPTNFSSGQFVGPANFTPVPSYYSFFRYSGDAAPNFGSGSYLGFRYGTDNTNWNYGYFEVTWNNVSNQFQILSGAYESTPNTAIAVPEPTGLALAGIGALALGGGAIRRSRKARKAAAEGSLAEAV